MVTFRSTTTTYQGDAQINFFSSKMEGLYATIDTKNLYIRPVEASDDEGYARLFGNGQIREKFADGKRKTIEQVRDLINKVWTKHWRENDPYSAFAIFRNRNGDLLGHVVLKHDQPGQAELAYLFSQEEYGSEAIAAIVKEYAPATVQEKYLMEGQKLKVIKATAKADSSANEILKNAGMTLAGQTKIKGILWNHYLFRLSEIQINSIKKVGVSYCEITKDIQAI